MTQDAGGGGGTAVLDKPITPPKVEAGTGGGGGGDPGEIDIMNYVAPTPTNDIFEGEDDPTPPPAAKKQEPSKKADPSPDAKKPATPAPLADNAPANLIRARLKEVESTSAAKIAELERQLGEAKSDPRIDQLTKRLEAAQKEYEAAGKQRDDYESKLLVHNPHVSKKLRELESSFNEDWKATMEIVPGLQPQYRQLLDEFAALPRGKDDYAEKLQSLKAKLREDFAEDMPTVFAALQKGLKFRQDHAKMGEDIQRDARGMMHAEQEKSWKEKHEAFEKEYPTYFEPPVDAADKDPLNVKYFLKEFEAGLPKEEVEKVNHNVKLFVDRVLHGAQPRRREDFPDLDDKGAKAEMDRIEGLVGEDRQKARALFSLSLKWMMFARPVIAEIMRQKKEGKKERDATPPDPTKDSAAQVGGNGEAFDFAHYNPALPTNADFGG